MSNKLPTESLNACKMANLHIQAARNGRLTANDMKTPGRQKNTLEGKFYNNGGGAKIRL